MICGVLQDCGRSTILGYGRITFFNPREPGPDVAANERLY